MKVKVVKHKCWKEMKVKAVKHKCWKEMKVKVVKQEEDEIEGSEI